jgi:hypothetical protein
VISNTDHLIGAVAALLAFSAARSYVLGFWQAWREDVEADEENDDD